MWTALTRSLVATGIRISHDRAPCIAAGYVATAIPERWVIDCCIFVMVCPHNVAGFMGKRVSHRRAIDRDDGKRVVARCKCLTVQLVRLTT